MSSIQVYICVHFNGTSANETILWKSPEKDFSHSPLNVVKACVSGPLEFLLLFSVSGRLSVKSLVNLSQGLGGY